MSGMIADSVLSEVTAAKTDQEALGVLQQVRSRQTLEVVADLLYIDFHGHGKKWLMDRIVKEARA